MLSSRSFAASEVPQASISLEDMESGELLLRAGNDLSSAILLSTDVKIHIAGTISRTIVSQRFINTGETWAKGVYVFPIGATAAVDTLKMRIGDRFIEGQIKEKKAAKKAYQTAKKSVAHRAEEAQFIHQHNCEYWSRRDCYSSD